VASFILALAAIAMVSLIRTAREIDLADRHRRTARTFILSRMEEERYSEGGYKQLDPGGTASVLVDPNVVLDTKNNLTGTLTITVNPVATDASTGGTLVDFIQIEMKMDWTEVLGHSENITLVKRVSGLD